jgi:hypothetical protein
MTTLLTKLFLLTKKRQLLVSTLSRVAEELEKVENIEK